MADQRDYSEEEEEEELRKKNSNALPLWGNEKTMNLNNLLLTNIQSSHYFKGEFMTSKCHQHNLLKCLFDEVLMLIRHDAMKDSEDLSSCLNVAFES